MDKSLFRDLSCQCGSSETQLNISRFRHFSFLTEETVIRSCKMASREPPKVYLIKLLKNDDCTVNPPIRYMNGYLRIEKNTISLILVLS